MSHDKPPSTWARLHAASARIGKAAAARPVGALGAAIIATGILLAEYFDCNCLLQHNDDSYITYRYAHNWATGYGLVFNPFEATDSASSFLYTFLLALSHRLGLTNLPVVACVLGIASTAATSAVVYLACLATSGRFFSSFFLACAVPANGLISSWAVSGMDTLLFTLLVTWTVYRLFIRCTFGWPETFLVIAVALTRFEGWILVGLWLALALARALAGTRLAQGDGRTRRALLINTGVLLGTLCVFLLWKVKTYGTLLPHALELKRITVLYAPRPRALWAVWWMSASVLLVLGAVGVAALPRRLESAALVIYVLVSMVSLAIGPFSDWARYSIHLLPVVAVLACVPLSKCVRSVPWVGVPIAAVVLIQGIHAFVEMQPSFYKAATETACRTQIGAFLDDHLPPGSVVLSSDIGAIAYAAPHIDFVDAVGLTSRDVLLARMQGHNADDVLFAKKPNIIADSCFGTCAAPARFSAYYWLTDPSKWLTPLPEAHYFAGVGTGQVLARCHSADGLSIAATRFDIPDADAGPTGPPP